jgi:hypothetical protein
MYNRPLVGAPRGFVPPSRPSRPLRNTASGYHSVAFKVDGTSQGLVLLNLLQAQCGMRWTLPLDLTSESEVVFDFGTKDDAIKARMIYQEWLG